MDIESGAAINVQGRRKIVIYSRSSSRIGFSVDGARHFAHDKVPRRVIFDRLRLINEVREMIQTIEATIDEKGEIRLAEPIRIKGVHRALVTVLEEPPSEAFATAMLSESSLATDWLRPEEDEAWSHL